MTNSIEDDQNKDLLIIELAHLLWFQQRGKNITNLEELHNAWQGEHIEATILSKGVIREMYKRGMLLEFFDKNLAQFAPKEEATEDT